LAHLRDIPCDQANKLRVGVAEAGGVLVEMRRPSFAESVDAFIEYMRSLGAFDAPLSIDVPLDPVAAKWNDYSNSFLGGLELEGFLESLTQCADQSSMPIS
jgi:hypothetical protein